MYVVCSRYVTSSLFVGGKRNRPAVLCPCLLLDCGPANLHMYGQRMDHSNSDAYVARYMVICHTFYSQTVSWGIGDASN